MGIAGRIAASFLNSRLTPLVTGASLLVGVLALLATPREEEPQISVPMIDVIAVLPGAGPDETENLLARPIERKMWEIPGVDYVYSMAGEGTTLGKSSSPTAEMVRLKHHPLLGDRSTKSRSGMKRRQEINQTFSIPSSNWLWLRQFQKNNHPKS